MPCVRPFDLDPAAGLRPALGLDCAAAATGQRPARPAQAACGRRKAKAAGRGARGRRGLGGCRKAARGTPWGWRVQRIAGWVVSGKADGKPP